MDKAIDVIGALLEAKAGPELNHLAQELQSHLRSLRSSDLARCTELVRVRSSSAALGKSLEGAQADLADVREQVRLASAERDAFRQTLSVLEKEKVAALQRQQELEEQVQKAVEEERAKETARAAAKAAADEAAAAEAAAQEAADAAAIQAAAEKAAAEKAAAAREAEAAEARAAAEQEEALRAAAEAAAAKEAEALRAAAEEAALAKAAAEKAAAQEAAAAEAAAKEAEALRVAAEEAAAAEAAREAAAAEAAAKEAEAVRVAAEKAAAEAAAREAAAAEAEAIRVAEAEKAAAEAAGREAAAAEAAAKEAEALKAAEEAAVKAAADKAAREASEAATAAALRAAAEEAAAARAAAERAAAEAAARDFKAAAALQAAAEVAAAEEAATLICSKPWQFNGSMADAKGAPPQKPGHKGAAALLPTTPTAAAGERSTYAAAHLPPAPTAAAGEHITPEELEETRRAWTPTAAPPLRPPIPQALLEQSEGHDACASGEKVWSPQKASAHFEPGQQFIVGRDNAAHVLLPPVPSFPQPVAFCPFPRASQPSKGSQDLPEPVAMPQVFDISTPIPSSASVVAAPFCGHDSPGLPDVPGEREQERLQDEARGREAITARARQQLAQPKFKPRATVRGPPPQVAPSRVFYVTQTRIGHLPGQPGSHSSGSSYSSATRQATGGMPGPAAMLRATSADRGPCLYPAQVPALSRTVFPAQAAAPRPITGSPLHVASDVTHRPGSIAIGSQANSWAWDPPSTPLTASRSLQFRSVAVPQSPQQGLKLHASRPTLFPHSGSRSPTATGFGAAPGPAPGCMVRAGSPLAIVAAVAQAHASRRVAPPTATSFVIQAPSRDTSPLPRAGSWLLGVQSSGEDRYMHSAEVASRLGPRTAQQSFEIVHRTGAGTPPRFGPQMVSPTPPWQQEAVSKPPPLRILL